MNRCNQCGGDYCIDDLLSTEDGSGEYRCKGCNVGRPIQESDYPAFMHWVNVQPADAIIARSCHGGLCVVARWYSQVTGNLVAVTILKHYLSEEDINTQNWQYNPSWVKGITEALDKHTGGYTQDVTQHEFVIQVLPIAYRWGVPKI